MSIEESYKDVIAVFRNKREQHLGLNKTFAIGYNDEHRKPLLPVFRNYIHRTRKQIKKLAKIYLPYYFDYEYLKRLYF